METIKSPVVVANLDASQEPTIDGKFNKSIIIHRGGRDIGIIGVLLTTTTTMADTKNLTFLDETESVKDEAEELNRQGVKIIIVLSHSGLAIDEYMAANVGEHVDLIVGAHSHTFLYKGNDPPGPDIPVKEYPVVITQESGHKVMIVQASAYAKYVGEFITYFDDDGLLVRYEGNPIFLGSDILPDPAVVAAMSPWKEEADKVGLKLLGTSLLNLSLSPCVTGECSLANLITDSFRRVAVKLAEPGEWTKAEIGVVNTGGIRTSLEKGDIIYGDAATILPFDHDLIIFDIRGDKLLQVIESSVSELDGTGLLLHFAGMKVTVNMKNPPNDRVMSVEVVCRKCQFPVYESIDLFQEYRVITSRYIAYNIGAYKGFLYGKNHM